MPVNDNDSTVDELLRLAGDDDASMTEAIRTQLRQAAFLLARYLAMRAVRLMKEDGAAALDDPETHRARQEAQAREILSTFREWIGAELVAVGIGSKSIDRGGADADSDGA